MPFRKDEFVVGVEIFMKNDQHGIERGQISTNMPNATFEMHLKQSLTRADHLISR
ncbi:hypothetical protein D3C81_2247910 [compost metagenome]